MGLNDLDIDGEIEKANERLGHSRTKIIRRGGTLWLRGTFPPKPHIKKDKPYQQKMSLGLKTTLAGIKKAEQEAKIISAQLELGTFTWTDWLDSQTVDVKSVGYWVEEFERDYWAKRTRSLKTERGYNATYAQSFSKLGKNEALTIELLVDTIKTVKPDTQVRKRLCRNLFNLGKFAGLEGCDVLLTFKGNYSFAHVDERRLPSDELIASVITGISSPGWRWWLGMVATYGIRPTEAWDVNLTNFPEIKVKTAKVKKETYRIVYPLYPEWADKWDLSKIILPNTTETPVTTYGQRLSLWARSKKLPFRPYDLRHCYARRCFEFKIPPDRAAKLLGHTLTVHNSVYRAWIDEGYYRNYFQEVVYREDRPAAPQ